MKTILIRALVPAAGFLLVGCEGMNPWASSPPRREKPTTDPHYADTQNTGNPYLKGSEEKPDAANATKTDATAKTDGAAKTDGNPSEPPPATPPPPGPTPPANASNNPPAANAPATPPPATTSEPMATPVPNKKGFVYNPFAPGKMIDCRGYEPGTRVRDPETRKIFIVP